MGKSLVSFLTHGVLGVVFCFARPLWHHKQKCVVRFMYKFISVLYVLHFSRLVPPGET